jgi:AcrR family transcriptional regulator
MSKINQQLILEKSIQLFARGGLGEFRIRRLSDDLDVSPSVIYHYFKDEETLLKEMYLYASRNLGTLRSALPKCKSTSSLLKQRIEFQIDHADMIVAVLKYYFAFRKNFPKNGEGFLPDKSALHMEEVLLFAQQSGEYSIKDVEGDAKVMTHSINGYLLEYFPYELSVLEKKKLTKRLHDYFLRSMKGENI